MCLIIDINCLSSVFNEEDSDHENFKPVYDWIEKGDGKIVMGGSKYFEELKQTKKYLKVIVELAKKNKVISLDDDTVDNQQATVEELIDDNGCDDPHLIAIVRTSFVKIICTKEERAVKYIKNKDLYESSTHRPKIYRTKRNANLLVKNNIANCCN